MVINLDCASRHLVQALADDTQAFSHLLNTAQVAVVAITVLADRDVELNLRGHVLNTRQLRVEQTSPRHTCHMVQPSVSPKRCRYHEA